MVLTCTVVPTYGIKVYSCTNISKNKKCKICIKFLRRVSVLIHVIEGVYSCVS